LGRNGFAASEALVSVLLDFFVVASRVIFSLGVHEIITGFLPETRALAGLGLTSATGAGADSAIVSDGAKLTDFFTLSAFGLSTDKIDLGLVASGFSS